MRFLRRIAPGVVLLAVIGLAARGLMLVTQEIHWVPARDASVTRMLAVTFLVCDVAVGAALVTLLLLRDRSAPTWAERRLPYGGRWLWHFLLGLTILCYAGLAPIFLFLILRLKD